jgi:hypothetical protein
MAFCINQLGIVLSTMCIYLFQQHQEPGRETYHCGHRYHAELASVEEDGKHYQCQRFLYVLFLREGSYEIQYWDLLCKIKLMGFML